MFSSGCGFVPRACVAYRPETKSKVEVTAKLVNSLKFCSGDITNLNDIQKVTSELNNDINNEICQATGKPLLKLLESEKPYLLKIDINILTGYFNKLIRRRVSIESLISYESRKYSVSPRYIGKYVDIEDVDISFYITFNEHFIRHWNKSIKLTNFNHSDYLKIIKCSTLKRTL